MTEPTEPAYVASATIRDALPAARSSIRVQPWQVESYLNMLFVEGLSKWDKFPATLTMTKGDTPDVLHIDVRISGLGASGQENLFSQQEPSTQQEPPIQPDTLSQP